MTHKGTIYIVSGPSGCGKTTLCNHLLAKDKGIVESISVTTRRKRIGEKKNRDYVYVSEAEFKRRIKDNVFLEHACVFGNYYGTPKRFVVNNLDKGRDVLLIIDVRGAAQVKKAMKEAVLIAVLPPVFSALEKRLRNRSSEGSADIKTRLMVAKEELRALKKYDYAVVNDSIARAVNCLSAIVLAHRCKI